MQDKRVLVVGASSGIGRGFALSAAKRGPQLALAARRREAVEAVAADCGGQAAAIVGDVTSVADCRRIVDEAVTGLGGLDAIFYTPAPGYQMLLDATEDEDWEAQFRAIVIGASEITRAALPSLSSGAVVAYLSSVVTRAQQYGMSSYAACKAALEAMIRGWEIEQPEFRFCSFVIGSTTGVGVREQHRRDPELRAEILRQMRARGFMYSRFMDAEDLGDFIATTVATMLAHPDIAASEMVLRPASPVVLDTAG
jgi:NAD(P)-dependent dehydrogenase (short-subunit alcohol dehydrogenase family)